MEILDTIERVLALVGLTGHSVLSFIFVVVEVNFAFQIVKSSPWYKAKVDDSNKDFYGKLICLGLATFFMLGHEYKDYNPAIATTGLLAGFTSTSLYNAVSNWAREKHPEWFLKMSGKTVTVKRPDGSEVKLKYDATGELEAMKEGKDATVFVKRKASSDPPAAA